MRTPYLNSYGGAMLVAGDSSASFEFHLGSGWRYGISPFNAFSVPPLRQGTYYIDTADVVISVWRNPSLTYRSFTMLPGKSKVVYSASDTVLGASTFNTFVCSTGTKIKIIDSVLADTVKVKAGKFFASGTIRAGTFIDSTTDTCKILNLYITKDAKFSSLSTLLWYSNAMIRAQGIIKQIIYSNGETLPKISVAKGTKLTIR